VTERIEATRDTLEKWVETRRLLSEEKRDWALAKDMLTSRAEILRGEVTEVDGRITEAEKSITDADRKAADLVAKNDALKLASSELAAMAATLETRTKDLVKRLPDPIREKLRPLTQRLPEDPTKSELPLSTRFQNIVGIVNEVNKFNRELTVTSEVRKLADGSSAEVTAVYLGLAQGYYVGGGGKLAGVGGATENGWTWTAANEYAPQIAKVVAILKNENPAEFVPVPLGVK
jgi:chromosome segregation ATPase